jgi:hypothetical protein
MNVETRNTRQYLAGVFVSLCSVAVVSQLARALHSVRNCMRYGSNGFKQDSEAPSRVNGLTPPPMFTKRYIAFVRVSIGHRILALFAAVLLCLSPAGQALAHGEAHMHLAEHAHLHVANAESHDAMTDAEHDHDDHDTDHQSPYDGRHQHSDRETEALPQLTTGLDPHTAGLFAADHPDHAHAAVDGASGKRESLAFDDLAAVTVVVEVPGFAECSSEPSARATDIAQLPRPGPDPGRLHGPRPPPFC